ncbi:polysialyltransferase family glycosyltransferase [Jonesia quinghaiensis]|uniref:polysialyltransferase family glycosyltransferase n=1 Tax=Jonesia quinghaiensis TaxID=262806 RepID=UPI00146B9942|nr:polysialyltransferase family glycosyltransferase [Jonesia quinghaiensis]
MSSQFQILAVCAALKHGSIPRPTGKSVLLICNNAKIPETHPFIVAPELHGLVEQHFDTVVHLNDLTHPLRPVDFSPARAHVHIWRRLLATYLGVPASPAVRLFLESVQTNPARALSEIFYDSPLSVHADGLMVYSPSRQRFSPQFLARVDQVIYLDMRPGVRPMLLNESSAAHVAVPTSSIRDIVEAQLTDTNTQPAGEYALILGQYVAALSIISRAEEDALYLAMIDHAIAAGHREIVFRMHPSAPPFSPHVLRDHAQSQGVQFHVDTSSCPVEFMVARRLPAMVLSIFSTGMVTASQAFSIPGVAIGTDLLLERLSPFQNSNRIPVTICDLLYAPDTLAAPAMPTAEVQQTIEAVSYCMQPQINPQLREQAEAFIANHPLDHTFPWRRYIKKKRAESLGLVASRKAAQPSLGDSPPAPEATVAPAPRQASKTPAHRSTLERLIQRLRRAS